MTHQIHADTEIGEVKLKVSNLEQSLTFYQDVIGFSLLKRKNKVVELTTDGKKRRLPNFVWNAHLLY
ncbi:VOC family protein [Metabacillus herbersteinensis]|uniref:VOC family protein n=1 Tax=Metabacillus herbersteinensis TaxID=283816 RepID=A0ABV6GCE6_9BACI